MNSTKDRLNRLEETSIAHGKDLLKIRHNIAVLEATITSIEARINSSGSSTAAADLHLMNRIRDLEKLSIPMNLEQVWGKITSIEDRLLSLEKDQYRNQKP